VAVERSDIKGKAAERIYALLGEVERGAEKFLRDRVELGITVSQAKLIREAFIAGAVFNLEQVARTASTIRGESPAERAEMRRDLGLAAEGEQSGAI
jgi:hypothetical protein